MNKEDFKKEAYSRGNNSKDMIKRWVETNPKNEYTEEDLKEVYHFKYLNIDTGKRVIINRDGSRCITTKKFQYDERHL